MSDERITPLAIAALMEAHVGCVNDRAMREQESSQLLERGLIRHDSAGRWVSTLLGQAHVEQVCHLPLPTPREVFVDYKGKIIE
jgi:hypothetical protein